MNPEREPALVARTARLEIRPWRPDEAPRLFDLLSRMEIVRWLSPSNLMTDPSQASERIERWAAEFAAEAPFGRWAAVERSSGIAAGTVMMKPLPDGDGEVELGWYLHPDSQGKGLASEAARALLEIGFGHGLDEIWAVMYPDNERSAAVCRRLGMRLLGVTNRWYHEPSLMFWIGRDESQEPSLRPDDPVAPE